jgi:hypothetical protein
MSESPSNRANVAGRGKRRVAMERVAECQCGGLRAILTGEPRSVYVCHCRACQRRTGAVMHSGAFCHMSQVRFEGPSHVYTRTGTSGGNVRSHFCPTCGTSVYWVADRLPDAFGIAVGCFADPDFPAPTFSVWEESKHAWVCLPETVQAHYLHTVPTAPAEASD